MRIIVLEDNIHHQLRLESALYDVAKNLNLHIYVECATTLEEFEDYKPSLVLMDIGLPAFNGYHWCSEIRNKSQVPIIFLSSSTIKIFISCFIFYPEL